MDLRKRNVGDIVAERFSTASIFYKFGIDFCCHGQVALDEACNKANADVDTVINAINGNSTDSEGGIQFASWPIDLLIDYVLKIHHRGIRNNGPVLLELIEKVRNAHADRHPELNELYEQVSVSLEDLENHLQKEENVLFPYLLELFDASERNIRIAPMHCGSIANPIRVMNMEHEAEGNRYFRIKEITNNFEVPQDGCTTYRLMMTELEKFVNALFEHIHIENNIMFPKSLELEQRMF